MCISNHIDTGLLSDFISSFPHFALLQGFCFVIQAAVLMMQGPNPPSLVLNEEEMGLTIEAEKKQQVST